MFWIALVAAWLLAAPLAAWVLGRSVALAEQSAPAFTIDEATAGGPCTDQTDGPTELQAQPRPELEPQLAATA